MLSGTNGPGAEHSLVKFSLKCLLFLCSLCLLSVYVVSLANSCQLAL